MTLSTLLSVSCDFFIAFGGAHKYRSRNQLSINCRKRKKSMKRKENLIESALIVLGLLGELDGMNETLNGNKSSIL